MRVCFGLLRDMHTISPDKTRIENIVKQTLVFVWRDLARIMRKLPTCGIFLDGLDAS